jgi:hypothetical protein
MQILEISCAVRPLKWSLGSKGLILSSCFAAREWSRLCLNRHNTGRSSVSAINIWCDGTLWAPCISGSSWYDVETLLAADLHYSSTAPFLGASAKSRKATVSFVMSVCMSVCTQGTTPLPLDGFSWNLVLRVFFFSKTCQENSSLIKIWHE